MPKNSDPHKKRAATLADVGKEAGVSVMAVSAVINGARTSTRISPDTRERILAAAAKLQYRPNAAARALADRRMNTIGVVTRVDSGELNHYFVNVFNGILEAAAKQKQNTTVFALDDWHAERSRLHSICDGRIDGAILLAPQFDDTDEVSLPDHTPFVTIHANIDLSNAVNLESDEVKGSREMVLHLAAQGHRRIMHITGPMAFRGAQRRLQGYKQGLAAAGITFDPDLVIHSDFNAAQASADLVAWIRRHAGQPMPTAIFCANDAMAIGCSSTLAERGIRIPDTISMAGFDDIILCRSTLPPLSTVRQPLHDMGAFATQTLLRLIEERQAAPSETPRNIVFDTEIVIRGSIAAPPAEPAIAST